MLVAVTVCIALAGAFLAFRTVLDSTKARFADGRVPTSFGSLWVESSNQISLPQTGSKDNFGMPLHGAPDKVMLEVTIRLANTTGAPVELTPDRFALRFEPGDKPVPAEGARFESVKLLPGAIFDARIQFPVKGGEHQPSLLFDDPNGSRPITIDLGRARFQETVKSDHHH